MILPGLSKRSATLDSAVLKVFTYRPAVTVQGLLLVFHGNSRNADHYCRDASDIADRHGLVVVAPLFDRSRFSNARYHRGGIVDGMGRVRPAKRWTTRFVPLLADWARAEMGTALPYWLWGFSAGGQFLSRVAAFERTEARRIVVGGASTYVLPLLGAHPGGERAPYGLGGVFAPGEERDRLRRYVESPLSFYIGGADDDRADPLLASGSAAARQGPNRLARGRRTFALGASVAQANGWSFGWRLIVGGRVGHESGSLLRSRRALDALHLAGDASAESDGPRREASGCKCDPAETPGSGTARAA